MRILLIDDHPLLRAGVRQLIVDRWPDAEVIDASDLASAVRLAPGCRAAVLDLSLPDAHGIEALVRLRRLAPQLSILVLSMHAEEAFAARALQLGAAGYLTKDRAGEELVSALERVLSGGRYITGSLASRLADMLTGTDPARAAPELLSVQELRVALLLAQGRSVADIAATVHLSVKTVSTYRARAFEKLHLATNADLTRYCLAHGLIEL
jgi:two-component system invasion response regulator UvrY